MGTTGKAYGDSLMKASSSKERKVQCKLRLGDWKVLERRDGAETQGMAYLRRIVGARQRAPPLSSIAAMNVMVHIKPEGGD